jgi:hypothetical protein
MFKSASAVPAAELNDTAKQVFDGNTERTFFNVDQQANVH